MGVMRDVIKILGNLSEDISAIRAQGVKIMADLTNLKGASNTVQSEVATLLTDFATALGNATSQADVDAVTQQLNATAASITAADPNAQPPASS
jgi:hypothetical protein